jgi:hypothetical protein
VFVVIPAIWGSWRYRRAALRGAFLLADVVGEGHDNRDPLGQ